MNKRKNRIFIACLSFLVVVSIGYAAFSENITISGASKSQATFNITTTCTKGLPSNIQSAAGFSDLEVLTLNRGYKNDSCTVSGNNVTVATTFEYPTASRMYTIKMTNNSTMDAMLKLNTDDDPEYAFLSSGQMVANTSSGTYTYTYGVKDSYYEATELLWLMNRVFPEYMFIQDKNGNLSQEFEGYYDSKGEYFKLRKGYSIYVVIYTTWQGEYYDSAYDDYSITSTSTFTFPFVQYTTDLKEWEIDWSS